MNENGENVELRVKLIPKAWQQLCDCADLTGYGRTNTVNRAIQLYCQIEMERRVAGADLAFVRADGTVESITFSDDPVEVTDRVKARRRRPSSSFERWVESWWPW